MASPPGSTPRMSSPRLPRTQRGKWKRWTTPSSSAFAMFLFQLMHLLPISSPNPHAPLCLTWQIIDTSSGTVLNQTSQMSPKDTWYPDLYVDLLSLIRVQWDPKFARRHHFYVCPGHSQTPRGRTKDPCGGAEDYFCASWSCVSTGHTWWTPQKTGDLIAVRRPNSPPCGQDDKPCNPVRISFTEQGKKATGWDTGKTWGIRFYDKHRLGYRDHGGLFTLRVRMALPSQQAPVQVGPNLVL